MKRSNPINKGTHLKARQGFQFLVPDVYKAQNKTKSLHSQSWEEDFSGENTSKKLLRNNLHKMC